MIAFLDGTLAGKTVDMAVVNVNGVGFGVSMSQAALSKLPEVGSAVQVRTYMHVTDGGITLYGFLADEEKAMFEKLIGVSGVGPKMALAALSTFSPKALADAIAAQDATQVSKIPGVGKKTAQRIILELKGALDENLGDVFSDAGTTILEDRLNSAMEALLSMGFTHAEAELALKGAPEGATEQALLQYALKRLA